MATTKPSYRKTSSGSLIGRRAGTWSSTPPSAKPCRSPGAERPLQPSYVLHGHTLENVSSAKYLGLTINNTVSWDDLISNTCSKANRALGFLRRNLKIGASNIKEKAYKVFVRSPLEYAASVWDPYSQKNIAKIEAVQRRANASSSTGLGTPRVSTTCWRRWAGLHWSNDARRVDC